MKKLNTAMLTVVSAVFLSAAPAQAQSGRNMETAHAFIVANLENNRFRLPTTSDDFRISRVVSRNCETTVHGVGVSRTATLVVDWRRNEMVSDGGSMDRGYQIQLRGDVTYRGAFGSVAYDHASFSIQVPSMRNRLIDAMSFVAEECFEERDGF